jgi:hypothetical protein
LSHEAPVNDNTLWFVVQVHFAPTPPVDPGVTLDVNPPGPADGHENV